MSTKLISDIQSSEMQNIRVGHYNKLPDGDFCFKWKLKAEQRSDWNFHLKNAGNKKQVADIIIATEQSN